MEKQGGSGIPFGRIAYIDPSVQRGSEAEVPLRATHGAGTAVKGARVETKGSDPDEGKGAVEEDAPVEGGNTSLNGQMGHRNKSEEMDDSDTDYPEPDAVGEHSGEKK